MYRIYKKILCSFLGDFKILVKGDIFLTLEQFYGSFSGVSRMIRGYHIYALKITQKVQK